jgi:hypothetical protein
LDNLRNRFVFGHPRIIVILDDLKKFDEIEFSLMSLQEGKILHDMWNKKNAKNNDRRNDKHKNERFKQNRRHHPSGRFNRAKKEKRGAMHTSHDGRKHLTKERYVPHPPNTCPPYPSNYGKPWRANFSKPPQNYGSQWQGSFPQYAPMQHQQMWHPPPLPVQFTATQK